jgi:hypothetical protein
MADVRWRQAARSRQDVQRKFNVRTLLKCPEPACDVRLHMADSRCSVAWSQLQHPLLGCSSAGQVERQLRVVTRNYRRAFMSA